MGRVRMRPQKGEIINNFEILGELPPREYNGYKLYMYKGKCLRCGTISIKDRYSFSRAGCRMCANKKAENIKTAHRLTPEQIERLKNAPYIMEGLLNLRNEIIMQAARDTRNKSKDIQESAWEFFESEMFKKLCIDLEYEFIVKEIKRQKRFRIRRL